MRHLALQSSIGTETSIARNRLDPRPIARLWPAAAATLVIGLCAANPAFASEAPQPVRAGADTYALTTSACVREFLIAMGSAGKSIAVKVPSAPKHMERIREPYAMDLVAINSSNGRRLGRSECVVRGDGTVVKLTGRLGKNLKAEPMQARSSASP